MNNRDYRTYHVFGTPEELALLEFGMAYMNACVKYGSSRDVIFSLDGDGSARVLFCDANGVAIESDLIKNPDEILDKNMVDIVELKKPNMGIRISIGD